MPLLIGRTPLVGRAHELAGVLEHLAAARAGKGGVVLLAGEAGIGKSRLVAEVTVHAAQQGFLVLRGMCIEPDRALPFAPFLDLLRDRFAGHAPDVVGAALGPLGPELIRLLPEFARHLPGITQPPAPDAEHDKRRLFHALAEYFGGLAASQPLILVVEDLHWADDTSLEFLLYLARRLAARRLLVLLTYRTDDVQPDLGHALAELERERLAAEVLLPRLSRAEVDALIRTTFGQEEPVHPGFLDTIHGLTEGNPFFVEEVLKALVATGDIYFTDGRWDRRPVRELRIPRTVQDAVRRRVEQMSEAARRTAVLAAVIGQRFDFSLLQELDQRDEQDLVPLIKEMIAAHLVVEESAEQFAFCHALTRQAIYSELLGRERRALHRRIAEAMERVYEHTRDTRAADLAYHFHAAGAWAEVLAYAQQAGERAQALYAPRSALEHFARALEAAGHLGIAPPPALYRARGIAHETLGDFEGARIDLEAALERAHAAGDRRAEWQALLDLGRLWASRDYARTGVYNRQALDLARAMEDPPALAHSLNRLGNWQLNVEQPLAGRQSHEEALAIFQALEDRRGIAETMDLLGLVNNMTGDPLQSEAHYRQAVALFRALDERQGLASSLSVLATRGMGYVLDAALSVPPTLTEPVGEAEEAVNLARAIGWRSGEAYALIVLGDCLATQGDFARALDRVRDGLAIAEAIEHREWMIGASCVLGALHRELLELPAARWHLEQALVLAREAGTPYWARIAAGLFASTCVAEGGLTQAAAALDAVLSPDDPVQMSGQRLCWVARVELALARGEAKLALEIVGRLLAPDPSRSGGSANPRLWHLRAEALAALGRGGEAEQALWAAANTASAQGRRPLLWRIHLARGRLFQAQARLEDAERAFSAARMIVAELAGAVPDERLRDTFLRNAAAMTGTPLASAPRRADRRAFGGLTARQRDVASLIARGKSNRAIAEELVLSERTVEGHVANILATLGLSARTQIAAWAVETGLAGGDR